MKKRNFQNVMKVFRHTRELSNGITLVAMIITIIVLIILAAISLNAIFSGNGILIKADEAKEKQSEAEIREKIKLLLTDFLIEKERKDIDLFTYFTEKKEEEKIEKVEKSEDRIIIVEIGKYAIYIFEEDLSFEIMHQNESKIKITSITLNKENMNILKETKRTLIATVEPNEATNNNLEWISDDSSIATVNSEGVVTGVSSGKVTITVKAKDGSGIKATCEIEVIDKEPVQITGEELEGEFIKYPVEYTCAYRKYAYEDINGWRLVNYTIGEDGYTLSNVKLISTGIPAMFVNYYAGSNNSWWISDETKLLEFKNNILGSSYNTSTSYASLKTAAGLYYNFGKINFKYSSSGYNLGYYTSIKAANGITYGSTNKTTVDGNTLFRVNDDDNVRLMTLMEVNREIGNSDYDTTGVSADIDTKGMYRLNQLTNVLAGKTYSSGTYYLATPTASSSNKVITLNYKGTLSYGGNGTQGDFGLRPLICISSDLQLVKNIDENDFVYYEMIY